MAAWRNALNAQKPMSAPIVRRGLNTTALMIGRGQMSRIEKPTGSPAPRRIPNQDQSLTRLKELRELSLATPCVTARSRGRQSARCAPYQRICTGTMRITPSRWRFCGSVRHVTPLSMPIGERRKGLLPDAAPQDSETPQAGKPVAVTGASCVRQATRLRDVRLNNCNRGRARPQRVRGRHGAETIGFSCRGIVWPMPSPSAYGGRGNLLARDGRGGANRRLHQGIAQAQRD